MMGGDEHSPASNKAEPQTLGDSFEICCCSWTGGKDCHLALLQAWRDPSFHVTCLVVFVPTPETETSFRAHPIDLMQAQAHALGLPLVRIDVVAPPDQYRTSYVHGLRHLRDAHAVRVILTGDMDRVGDSATNWITDCCSAATGIRAHHPLWQADRQACWDTLLREDFHVLLSCVKQPWFDASWCGRHVTSAVVKEMVELSERKASTTTGKVMSELDLGGEQGEYHTMCLDGPFYQHPIALVVQSPPRDRVTPAAPDGKERWWTYDGQTTWVLGDWSILRE